MLAIVVAFVGNKYLAFRSDKKGKLLAREAAVFLIMRLATLGFEALFLYFTIQRAEWAALPAKILDNAIVIVLNYVLSKAFVF